MCEGTRVFQNQLFRVGTYELVNIFVFVLTSSCVSCRLYILLNKDVKTATVLSAALCLDDFLWPFDIVLEEEKHRLILL